MKRLSARSLWSAFLLVPFQNADAFQSDRRVSYRSTNSLKSRRSLVCSHAQSGRNNNDSKTQQNTLVHRHQLNTIDRVFCLSDLHTDHADNQSWLRERMNQQGSSSWTKRDLLVVAGDISHDMEVLEESLGLMLEHCQVFFVCGNHEAWLSKHEENNMDSLQKLQQVYQRCRELGVLVDPCVVQGENPLIVMPIQSWYDGSLCFSEELCNGFPSWPWVDFIRCRFPTEFAPKDPLNPRTPSGLVEHLLSQNKANLDLLKGYSSDDAAIMTVSHFLPNQQTLPDWIDLEQDDFSTDWLDHGAVDMSAKFSKVAGSRLIDQQLRSIHAAKDHRRRRHLHVFGHSHRPKDFEWNDIRYIHNPLGKPRERQLQMISPQVDFQLLWDSRTGEVAADKQVLRYWEEQAGGREALWARLEQVRPGRYQKAERKASSS